MAGPLLLGEWEMRIRLNYENRLKLTGVLFLLPALLLFIVLKFVPAIIAIYTSFNRYSLVGDMQWVGLDNYRWVLSDPLVTHSFKISLVYVAVQNVILWVLSLGLANALVFGKVRFSGLLQTIYFLPVVITGTVVAVIWGMLLYHNGPIDALVRHFTDRQFLWLDNQETALWSVILVGTWSQLGYYTMLFIAGLLGIPDIYYEAAVLDGANSWQRFRKITMPLLRPTTLFVIIISLIRSLQSFDLFKILTDGGPGDATRVIVMLVYQRAFEFLRMGEASALSVLMWIILLILTVIQLRFFGEYDV